MEKRVIIFGVCEDRCLNIFEYGNSVDYDDLVKEYKDVEVDEEYCYEMSGEDGCGEIIVEGCGGLWSYFGVVVNISGIESYDEDELDDFRFNIIKYKDIDVSWKESWEDELIEDLFDDDREKYEKYVKYVKKFLEEGEEENSWREEVLNNYSRKENV